MENSNSGLFNLKALTVGAVLVTLYVSKNPVMDPVNVSKMVLASALGFFFWFDVISHRVTYLWKIYRNVMIISVALLISSVSALIFGQVPSIQNFYGVFGRNTGFLTYLSLLGIFLGVLAIQNSRLPEFLVKGILVSGIANVVYCLAVLLGYDFFNWNNQYGNILGTFGNPNFISAFLGIFTVVALASLRSKNISKYFKYICTIAMPVAVYEIFRSNAVQGVVILAFGVAFIGLFYVREKFSNNLYTWSYLGSCAVLGIIAVAGVLRKGPLAQYIYQATVSLRGVYWNIGIEIGKSYPFTGVGFDGYGDFYRAFRDEKAMITPGPKVVTNSAHNVFIDFFTSGGFPLLICYLAFVVAGAIAIVRVFFSTKKYDPLFVAIATAWACYYLQSIISINQIGLAIWGWILNGAVIAYSRHKMNESDLGSPKVQPGRSVVLIKPAPKFAGVLGLFLGLLIALPPYIRDAGWVNALNSQSAEKVSKAATAWPMDIQRTNNLALFLEQNKASGLARDTVLRGLDFNERSFDGWRLLYVIQATQENEKQMALTEMKSLDPLNLKFE